MINFSDLRPRTPTAKLIYLDKAVEHNLIATPDNDLNFYLAIHQMINLTGHMIARKPGFPNPFNIHVWQDLLWDESLTETTTLSLTEITDGRANDIAHYAQTNDLPIVISYSGGIDSTLLVAAVCKNWDAPLLDRVIIKMTNASYFENPYFYRDVISKRFKVTNQLIYDWNNAIVLAGEPGDAVTLPNVVVEMDLVYPGSWQFSARTNPDILIKWLGFSTNKENAIRYYETLMQNGLENGFQIETYEDFFWYGKQVIAYGCNRMKLINQYATPWVDDSWQKFQDNAVAWFHTLDYRLWSATHRNTGEKYDGNVGNFKKAFKEYIYDFYPDPYYLAYKAKTFSPFPQKVPTAALYDDGTHFLLK